MKTKSSMMTNSLFHTLRLLESALPMFRTRLTMVIVLAVLGGTCESAPASSPPERTLLATDRPRLILGSQPVDDKLAHQLGLPLAMGLHIQHVLPDSPADISGMQQGDVLLLVHGRPVDSQASADQLLSKTNSATSAPLLVLRDGSEIEIEYRWIPTPPEQQLTWIRKLAELGDAHSRFLLGQLLMAGEGVASDREAGLQQIKAAAAANHRQAARFLGDFYFETAGVRENGPQALRWYLASLPSDADNDSPADARVLYCSGLLLSQHPQVDSDYGRAARLFKRAAALGDAPAWLALGRLYADGLGVPKDERKAFLAYQRAWKLGYLPAAVSVGLAHETGTGTPTDATAALKTFRSAAEKGWPAAMTRLGISYQFGLVTPRNLTQARQWYERAAEQNDPLAAHRLGELFEHGLGVTADRSQALKFYRQAADQGRVEAHADLGRLLDQGDDAEAHGERILQHFEIAANAGLPQAQVALGYCYLEGRHVSKDLKRAVVWFRRAAEIGNPSGASALGMMYEHGWGVEADRAEAIAWYLKAVDGNNAWAKERLEELQQGTD
jgi:TPR repeat protein